MTATHERELRRLIADASRQPDSKFELDTELAGQLGMDSLSRLRLLALIEKRFDVHFPDERLSDLHTMRQLLAVIDEQHKEDLE